MRLQLDTAGVRRKKAGGSDNGRGVSPVFGQPTLVVSTKDEFFNHWNECITHDCRQQPELPSSPRHLKESLTPRCHSAQWMNGVYQAVNQHWPLRQERGSDTSEYQSLPRKARPCQTIGGASSPPIPPVDRDNEYEIRPVK